MTADPFRADAVGMCPATLLPEPMTCDAAGLRDLARASAAAGFPTFSLWSFYATGNGVDTARMMFDDAGVSVRAVEAATRWAEGPEETFLGVNAIAAPVFDHNNDIAYALAVVGSIHYIANPPPAELIDPVRLAAADLSKQLGQH